MKRLFSPLGLTLASVLVALILVEVLLRIFGVSFPLFTQADADTGFALRPGAAGWVHDEGVAYVRINAEGFRDRDHTVEKPSDTLRIAVIGDSYTEARQVEQDERFTEVLEKELQNCPSKAKSRIEVMNFGVSGFGTAQELLLLRSRVWKYKPLIVMLMMTTGNDIRNNSAELEGNADKPYMRVEPGKLVTDLSFRRRPSYRSQTSTLSRFAQWAVSHSRVLQLVNRARSSFTSKPSMAKTASGTGTEVGLDNAIYLDPPPSQEWSDAWRATEAMLMQMSQEVREHNARLLVVTGSNGIQVNPDPEKRAAFAKSLGVNDLFAPDRNIAAMGSRRGFLVLNLAPELAKIATEKHLFLHGFPPSPGEGHWNADGHREAGTVIAAQMCGG